jgi:hypothetical protein
MSQIDLDVLSACRLMLPARTIDERQCMLNRQGKIPFVAWCQGQEATQVGIALALRPSVDVADVRVGQLGLRMALVEKAALGAVCPNRRCIPDKTLLRSAFLRAPGPQPEGQEQPQG